jgi:hypothetical protein
VLIAAECSTPINEVERFSVSKATRYLNSALRLIEAKRRPVTA